MLVCSKIMTWIKKNENYYQITKTMFMTYFNKNKNSLTLKDSMRMPFQASRMAGAMFMFARPGRDCYTQCENKDVGETSLLELASENVTFIKQNAQK